MKLFSAHPIQAQLRDERGAHKDLRFACRRQRSRLRLGYRVLPLLSHEEIGAANNAGGIMEEERNPSNVRKKHTSNLS